MSAPDEGPHCPPVAPRSTSASPPSDPAGALRRRRRRGSARVHEHGLGDVVDVDDAHRVLDCSLIERKLRFQHLVRHFLSQILHGCKSAYCTTSTCLSAQKRNARKPVRPPTQLTARALAHYLASQDNAHMALCPHELRVLPVSLEIDGAIGTCLQRGWGGEPHYSVYPPAWWQGDAYTEATAQHGTSRDQQRIANAVNKQQQTRKDAKSLSQNLFDTVTMIYTCSQQLYSSTSVLESLRSPKSTNSDECILPADALAPRLAAGTLDARRQSQDGACVTGANSESVIPHVNRRADLDRRRPQARLQSHSQLRTSIPPAETLSNGQQVHKIPYHLSDPTNTANIPRISSQNLLDGAQDTPRLSIMKTGRKNFTLGGLHPDPAQISLQSANPCKTGKLARLDSDSHLAIPVLSNLTCDTLEQLKDEVDHPRKHQLPNAFNFAVDFDTKRHFQHSKPFVNRSLFYSLSHPEVLLESFRDENSAFAKSPLPHLDSARLTHSFRDWNQRNGALIFDSLWIALEALHTPPPELSAQKSPMLRPSRKGVSADCSAERPLREKATTSKAQRYLNNLEAAHIVMVCVHALTSSVSVGWPHTWAQLRTLRAWGIIIPNAASDTNDFTHPYLNIIDELEYEPAVRLADRLLRAIGARTCFEHVQSTMSRPADFVKKHSNHPITSLVDTLVQHLAVVERVALDSRRRLTPSSSAKVSNDPGWTVTATLVEWLKTIITKKWDSKPTINKWSAVGTAVILLDKLGSSCRALNLREQMFEIPFLNEQIDAVEEPLRFLTWDEQPNTLHILQFPRLFPMKYLVRYFRTVNFSSMMAQYDQTTRVRQMQRSLDMFLRDSHRWLIKTRMDVTLSEYLVLDISRDHPLQDALNQLWGLEKRMLLKPLKVNMGKHEGEVGADHGGVTYEFFRVVLSQAFQPDHGMFTLHPQTQMTWFQPGTLEPDWKFEMIGILFSLAVYNGITLPVTFPLALYRFLLPHTAPFRTQEDNEDSVSSIKDGWPDLANGFEHLLAWADGEVQNVFMRDYAFSYEAFGHRIDHNMEEPFTQLNNATLDFSAVQREGLHNAPSKEAKLVTSENRVQFVSDYVRHLTYISVASQISAFRKGFLACLQPKSLLFFSPDSLRSLVEGVQHISITDLRQCARYEEGYSSTHSTIQTFWRIVGRYSQDDCRRFLEFVTASDRVPVTGYESITFHIVRTGNVTMLPTSSTCFGKLYLPDYSDEELLQTKLELAIKNSKGFGVV